MSSRESVRDPEIDKVIEDWELLQQERPRDSYRSRPPRVGSARFFAFSDYAIRMKANSHSEKKTGQVRRWVYFTFETDPQSINAVRWCSSVRLSGQWYVSHLLFLGGCPTRPDHTQPKHRQRGKRQSECAVVVLYLNALTEAERHDIRRESWANDLTIPIVDEVLLAYLARCGDDRFRTFLEVSLPFTAANPYNPETAGWGSRVAPEMFYGREQLAREIVAMRDGTSLIFGGRQLGKTALLRHVEKMASHPDLRRFAWFIDLKARGYVPDSEPVKDPRDILEVLHGRFRQEGILGDEYERAQPRTDETGHT